MANRDDHLNQFGLAADMGRAFHPDLIGYFTMLQRIINRRQHRLVRRA